MIINDLAALELRAIKFVAKSGFKATKTVAKSSLKVAKGGARLTKSMLGTGKAGKTIQVQSQSQPPPASHPSVGGGVIAMFLTALAGSFHIGHTFGKMGRDKKD